ncbi:MULTISPECIES: DUF481 domain-containing protein [Ectothiorhodospira]|uniref:DUF481 domain-containing protein n=1 Tax=Ectothiorhodospira TaxID=1051 RepID=UPI001EE7D1E9|nr:MULTISPECIES: DUF481 domain-containing protein [Ectothiorhodospira]MCG5494426.1 DUF481 domain-containing protein [Ectothiorhodospira variabilis]MCG5498973.1 DUF481 domain-containing protein [Ectothiorhodospira variabilis]MCG5503203.1 DUF481 domain-containing protein [Ectothiorhodospira variabilis]MCG5506038.1 DUF481 domain-containing protein [Ectothiorhodospira variabilis]MCG5523907.1 DUF481 domain-containing protein [Ectothiorhodospira haloalkaliphila]
MLASPTLYAEWGGNEGWSGDAEFGAVFSSGNTDSQNISARSRLRYEIPLWRHTLQLEAFTGSEDGATTQERYLGTFQTDRKLTARDYLFGALRTEKDRFSGYDYQRSLSAGYGRRVADTERLRLDLEAGAGARQARLEDGDGENETIFRGAGALDYRINSALRFTEDLLIQAGDDNTEVESISALRYRLNDRFTARFALTVKHNTDVPEDRDKTDTITSISLVYDLWN